MYGEIPDYRYRLIDYVGDGIVIGSSIGPPYYFTKGFFNSPSGGRLAGGVRAVRTDVPRFAGRLAGRLAVFWALESGMSLARRREDHWNHIVAGAGTYALGNMHRGAPAAARSALLAATAMAGLSVADLSIDLWHSRLLRSGREVGENNGLPALVPSRRVAPCRAADAPGGSIENRSENDVNLFGMEQKSDMTPKDV